MAENYFSRYRSTPQPTLTVREKEAGITQSGASAASSAASAEATRAKMLADELANKRRRATPEEVKAQGLDPKVSYQIDGLGRFILNPGQAPAKKPIVDETRVPSLRSALSELETAEKMAKDGFLTVGRPAEIITNLPFIGGLLNQPRTDFEATNKTVESRLIQDAIARLAVINQGGVTGMANTPLEAQRMAAAVANLDPSQSESQYLRQTARARAYIEDELSRLGFKYSDKPLETPARTVGPSDADRARAILAERLAARRAKDVK